MLINCKNVKFIREQEPILSDINWQIDDNENWAILGLNGSGKTTLLKLITGYEWPSSGDLTVLNQPFGKTSIPDLKKRIGWVSSDLRKRIKEHEVAERVVLSGKFASIGIWEDVTESDKKLAIDMLSLCGGKELIGKPYGVLSQGQQQIVIIARALMAKPELLIFDEPCNGLDLFAREAMLDKINTIANEQQAKGLIFVTHYIEEIPASFDHILLIKDGKIFAKGLKSDVLTPDFLTRFYDNSVEVIKLPDNRLTIIPKSSK
ncbi:ABC transporter ATP-binding protein [Vagococcus bubulae]|uniref:ABC transporter ATP-binding protein n=1 Tax=Vagococcus bubulae TaxID=1977868 RepID=UPI0022E1C9BF|nr:ABC transporter ATP-binding protein [Vagococcus bubulae]